MLQTLVDLEKSNLKRQGQGGGGGDKAKKPAAKIFYPKKIVVGNKKDLRRKKESGVLTAADINLLEGIKIREVSALTNLGIQEVLKLLVTDMNNDKSFDKLQDQHFEERCK